jgi:hypothetical protein
LPEVQVEDAAAAAVVAVALVVIAHQSAVPHLGEVQRQNHHFPCLPALLTP